MLICFSCARKILKNPTAEPCEECRIESMKTGRDKMMGVMRSLGVSEMARRNADHASFLDDMPVRVREARQHGPRRLRHPDDLPEEFFTPDVELPRGDNMIDKK